MQIITNIEEAKALEDNRIIGAENIEFKNSDIRFNGKGNILFCEKGVRLVNSHLKFMGDNCLIYLCENSYSYILDLTLYRNSVFYMGEYNYINGVVHAILSERKHIIIGSGNLFSFGIWMRTADPHLVFSGETHKRINDSRSIFIGDHVWLGQSAMILKGSELYSGSILGAMALSSGKRIPSNTSWGGNPARQIGENIFWERSCVHNWNEEQTEKYETYASDEFLFEAGSDSIAFSEIEAKLEELKTPEKRIDYLSEISANNNKNRFAADAVKSSTKKKHGLFRS